MNILIEGSGSIGISIGTSMISEGAIVSFHASQLTATAMEENGVERTGIFKHITCSPEEFKVYTDYEKMPKKFFDYIFVCTKTIVNDEVSSKLNENKDILKDSGKIIIFQNGFANDEPYLRFFDENHVFCARVISGFKRTKRNISEVTAHAAPLLLGSLQNVDAEVLKPVAQMLSSSGIPSETTNELAKYLWDKMLFNCTLNPLSAILEVTYGQLTENEYSLQIMDNLIDEIFNVIISSGYTVDWKSAEEYKEFFYSKLIIDAYKHVSSTLQDIQHENKTEIDSLTGTVISLGEKNNVDVSTNKMIYNLIKAIEAKYL